MSTARFRLQKVYIFLTRITSRVDLAMPVCLSVRMNVKISETIRAGLLGLGMQIPELLAQRKFVSAGYPRTAQNCGSFSFDGRIKTLAAMYCSYQYLSINPQKDCHAHFNAHKLQKIENMNAGILETNQSRELGFPI